MVAKAWAISEPPPIAVTHFVERESAFKLHPCSSYSKTCFDLKRNIYFFQMEAGGKLSLSLKLEIKERSFKN